MQSGIGSGWAGFRKFCKEQRARLDQRIRRRRRKGGAKGIASGEEIAWVPEAPDPR
jgi:hypothetical protein